MSTTTSLTETKSKHQQLLDKLPEHNVDSLWTSMHAMVTTKPSPKADVALWKYKELRPLLLEAGNAVSAEEAERRVLMLTNPALKPPFTTDTVYAGLQLINKGEIAPAHRHRSFALRFIIEGSRGFTAVEGEKIYMSEGDVILTPKWKWHDHGHEGDGPMIWLDGLDLPLYHCLPTHFAEPYSSNRYPRSPVKDSPLCFPWKDMKMSLDDTTEDWSMQTYHHADQEYVSGTLGAHAERVKAGIQSPPRRDTCAYIYHVQSGSGKSEITKANGEVKTVVWEKSDTFAVPAWSLIVHTADEISDAYFFVLSDRPLLENLQMYAKDQTL
ncbi:hypothetical protein H2200_013348 [Cladophialophora chaetospira]|uniref:Cupin type-2 domain-containing protein n=1 Tax=Cladophialophora chaetospira TaxID=386627 RepID=A0AA38WW47_9EURO|nr:hypothetical protein H2200_013348 [Cladophialophora chaetospira]